ncbi:ras-like GTP-binding protein Rho1 [Paramacrobiotus metropolitanus]|uniref:ras-like GTP-binding protein Rho1 n=1 Tax=Paramacrobiotus metropolitanus TaxID=2943436 RepID=UPI0024456EA6|nr:ras-like GTP-binding protein Rho1 [Paramacrobiotus metropolitanus]
MTNQPKVRCAKVVVVGDPVCGKTSLLMVFCNKTFPSVHIPTVFENFVTDVIIDNKKVETTLWDTAGQEDFDRLRPLSYRESDAVIIVYSVDNPTSLQNVSEKWSPEVRHFCPGIPVILVGNKTDLRAVKNDESSTVEAPYIEKIEGEALAFRIGAKAYLECSAKTSQGVTDLFLTAVRHALLKRKERSSRTCSLL